MTKVYQSDDYDAYAEHMHKSYPQIFEGKYGGFEINSGWWHIVDTLCGSIQNHIDNRQRTRELLLTSNPYNIKISDEVPQVIVAQIKEKFGGLRFYYEGGDDIIRGMVSMAESWAAHVCEQCGQPGELRYGGWIKTLCDHHEAERQQRMNQYATTQ